MTQVKQKVTNKIMDGVLKDEFEAVNKAFYDVVETSSKVTERIQRSINFYESYSAAIMNFINSQVINEKMVNTILENPNTFDTPGFPGTDFVYFNNFFLLLNSLLSQYQSISSTLESRVITKLKILNHEFEKSVHLLAENIQVASFQRSEAIQAYEDTIDKIKTYEFTLEKAYAKYGVKKSDKLKESLRKKCFEYQKLVAARHIQYQKMKNAHCKYLAVVSDCMYKVKLLEAGRVSNHKATIQSHCKIISENIVRTFQIVEKFTGNKGDWHEDIQQFFQRTGICRYSWSPNSFTPHRFSFEDNRVEPVEIPKPGIGIAVPISFCVVKLAHEKSSPNEITANEGEKFYCYDCNKAAWTFIANSEKEGFIPSTNIELIKGNYAICTSPYLSDSSNVLTAYAGELFRKIVDDDDNVLYENLQGERGRLGLDCFLNF